MRPARRADRTVEPGPGAAPPIVWVNGRPADAGAPHISALDRGFTLADGVFETMRAYGGVIFRLDQHLRRLDRATVALGIALPSGATPAVTAALAAAAGAGRREASVRVTVSRGVAAPGVAPPASAEPTVVVAVHEPPRFPPATYSVGLAVRIASGRRNERAMTAGLKTLAYTDSVAALAEARASGADDALFLDTEGHLSEGTSSNVFVVTGEALATPPLSCGALPGITRAAVAEVAAELGLSVEERPVTPDELFAADEVLLTSSLRAIAPVVRVNGRPIGRAVPGPVTRRVMDGYASLVRRECAA